jgi:hypothetical protein
MCISVDLSRTIKNEWFGSIDTVLLSIFTGVNANAEDPDAYCCAFVKLAYARTSKLAFSITNSTRVTFMKAEHGTRAMSLPPPTLI